MTATGRGVAAHALAILADGCDPDARRRAETYVQALPQPDLEAVFLALPILDGMVRREIGARTKTAPSTSCLATHESRGGIVICDLGAGHTGNHMAPDDRPGEYVRWG